MPFLWHIPGRAKHPTNERECMIIYAINPIDLNWEHLKTVEETVINLMNGRGDRMLEDSWMELLTSMIYDWVTVQTEAKASRGWEGDFRRPEGVLWLPCDMEFRYAFVWKQDNNGTTFIASPIELPWLKEEECDTGVVNLKASDRVKPKGKV